MNMHKTREMIVETVKRNGWARVSREVLGKAFPDVSPALALALALGGHRANTPPAEQMQNFATDNGLTVTPAQDASGEVIFELAK